MPARIRRHGGNGLDAWPGYVDALSTLLMVIMFVLLVFILAQAFLQAALSGRSRELAHATEQLTELTNALSLEKGKESQLQLSVAQLGQQLQTRAAERDKLSQQLSDAQITEQAAEAANTRLQSQLGDITNKANATAAQLTDTQAEVAKLTEQARALAALRDQLEKQAQDAAVHATTEDQRRQAVQLQLDQDKKLGDTAQAQIALLNQQVDELKQQLSSVASALDLAKQQGKDKDVQITNLGQKLNAALASKVQELQGYRSEFFGQLRKVLANRPGIDVVGDRFVFQSEVLFPAGRAELTQAGAAQMTALAITIKDIAREIPPDINWVLRVDGHTDPQPVRNRAQFASNWELAAGRAISVVKLLIADGVPPEHLAATAFGQYQPIAEGSTPEAYAKDRRIELRLTDR
jgi:chemotaxis protein MotB